MPPRIKYRSDPYVARIAHYLQEDVDPRQKRRSRSHARPRIAVSASQSYDRTRRRVND